MARPQLDNDRRQSAIQNLLQMFRITNTPTIPSGDDDLNGEADEPPDDQLSPLQSTSPQKDNTFMKSTSLLNERRESLLTRAIMGASQEEQIPVSNSSHVRRGMSTTSSHSAASFASTAELTSDGGISSPARTNTPSPPHPPTRYADLHTVKVDAIPPSKVVIAPATKDDRPTVVNVSEANVEATLGRKRCIMFACGGKAQEKPKPETIVEKEEAAPLVLPKRKCVLTFACPSRDSKDKDLSAEVSKRAAATTSCRRQASPPSSKHPSREAILSSHRNQSIAKDTTASAAPKPSVPSNQETSPAARFHEFGSSHDEPDAWVNETHDHERKLTLTDCMKKENAIRQIGVEAEEEAEQEEQEAEELDAEIGEGDNEDDFAPSEDGSSDAGNETDNEEGFADSDDEHRAGSDDLFWTPSTATSALPSRNQFNHLCLSSLRPGSLDSLNSSIDGGSSRKASSEAPKHSRRSRPSKVGKMRPSTPELPDSTDFVCGTLDEDRPLEAAYISCREQKKREKHIPIPQDIDPSFPTSDPEDNGENEEEEREEDNELWLKDQLDGFEDDTYRGRGGAPPTRITPIHSPKRFHSPPPKALIHRPGPAKYPSRRSPPPSKHHVHRSPPPRRLFGHSPTRVRYPSPTQKLKSPPGTRRPSYASSPTGQQMPLDVSITNLAQRPHMTRTASLPHTSNPFFRNYKAKTSQAAAFNLTPGQYSPGTILEVPVRDMHVRGPVDIVIGLEKKRQKRRDKFWQRHCRKHAKEQAERKPVPGRGAERMKELGLECAERTRGYGLGQPAQLVISL